ncbi:MAG: hypothetical protein WD066_01360, partial [Planctomycetaceae bacterium]
PLRRSNGPLTGRRGVNGYVWSGGSMAGIYGTQIAAGEFNPFFSLFGIPFVLGSVFLWTVTLMAVCGKVVVGVIDDQGTVFVGVGSIGWRRRFDWREVNCIREESHTAGYPGGYMRGILLEGKSRLKFGTNLNEQRRYFMLNALKYLKTTRR